MLNQRLEEIKQLVAAGELGKASTQLFAFSSGRDMARFWQRLCPGDDKVPQLFQYVTRISVTKGMKPPTARFNIFTGELSINDKFFVQHIENPLDFLFLLYHERNHLLIKTVLMEYCAAYANQLGGKARNFMEDMYINAYIRALIPSNLPERFYTASQSPVEMALTPVNDALPENTPTQKRFKKLHELLYRTYAPDALVCSNSLLRKGGKALTFDYFVEEFLAIMKEEQENQKEQELKQYEELSQQGQGDGEGEGEGNGEKEKKEEKEGKGKSKKGKKKSKKQEQKCSDEESEQEDSAENEEDNEGDEDSSEREQEDSEGEAAQEEGEESESEDSEQDSSEDEDGESSEGNDDGKKEHSDEELLAEEILDYEDMVQGDAEEFEQGQESLVKSAYGDDPEVSKEDIQSEGYGRGIRGLRVIEIPTPKRGMEILQATTNHLETLPTDVIQQAQHIKNKMKNMDSIFSVVSERAQEKVMPIQTLQMPSRLSRSDLVHVAAGIIPPYWNTKVPCAESNFVIYVDVSSSLQSDWPLVLHLYKVLHEYVDRIFQFSEEIVEINDPHANRLFTTAGTDFDIVARHINNNGFQRVIIISDDEATLRETISVEELIFFHLGGKGYGSWKKIATKYIPL